MIRKETAQAAIDLAQELERVGLCIKAQKGGEIDQLNQVASVSFSLPVDLGAAQIDPTSAYTPNADVIEQDSMLALTSPDGQSYGSDHAFVLEKSILGFSEPMAGYLNVARNVVKPAVVEFHTRIDAYMRACAQPNLFNPEVTYSDVPDPLINPSIMDEINKFKSEPFAVVDGKRKVYLPERSAEEIKELLLTNNNAVDSDIHNWLLKSGVGDGLLIDVWNNVFSNNENSVSNFESMTSNMYRGADAAMVVFLIARNIAKNPLEGATGTLAMWRSEMGELEAQSAVRLLHALETRAQTIRLGQLVVSKTKTSVVVNKPVYDEFISQGGNDTILFGVVLSDRLATCLPDIMNDTGQFLSIWENQNRIMNATALNRRFSNLKSAILIKSQEMIAENFKSYYIIPANGTTLVDSMGHPMVQQSLDNIEKIVDDLTTEDCNNLWEVALRVIARGIFGYTDSYEILKGIEMASLINQDADIGECSLVANLEYLVDALLDQLEVATLK
jgi:hypothetical protein